MIIAIDGPAASGKGTLGKRLARHYGYRHLDTGVIYRAVAFALLDAGIELTDEKAAVAAAMELDPEKFGNPALKTQEIGDAATEAVFAGAAGLTAVADATQDSSKLLLKVTEVAPPIDPLASFPTDQEGQLASMLKTDFVQSYINILQNEYPVVSYPAAIQAAQMTPQ